MSADLAARLRVLAQDYGEGRLSLATYRKLRAPLIDSLELRSASNVDDDAITRPRAVVRGEKRARPAGERGASPSKRNLIVAVAVVGVALAAGAAIFLTGGGSDDADSVADAPAPPPNVVATIVAPFLDRGDWSDAHIAALNAALTSLGTERLAAAANEPDFRRLTDHVRRRFKEQQALASAPLAAHSSPLAALAATVGLDLDSPDAALRIAPQEPPAQVSHAAHADAPEPVSRAPRSAAMSSGAQISDRPVPPATAANARPSTSGAASVSTEPASEPAAPRDVARNAAQPASLRSASASRPSPGADQQAAPRGATDDPCKASLIGSRRPMCRDVLASGEAGPELALVAAGAFDMGSTASAAEQPVHRVTLAKPFAISIHEVSQAEFRLYCERTRSSCAAQPWSGDDYPAVNVSWNDARAYAEWLSGVTRQRYRLPTEAEWEYAARAGQSGLFPSGDALAPTDAWFSLHERVAEPARRSQRFNPNRFRLLHTLGNVREWVQDPWTENFQAAPAAGIRVVRGGSYADGTARLRLSMREGLAEGARDAQTGFRVARDLQ